LALYQVRISHANSMLTEELFC